MSPVEDTRIGFLIPFLLGAALTTPLWYRPYCGHRYPYYPRPYPYYPNPYQYGNQYGGGNNYYSVNVENDYYNGGGNTIEGGPGYGYQPYGTDP